jgi:hypothetical protein
MLCAIHQPNFFPWLGYFDKLRRSDCFVFLDDVAYPKSGSGTGSWCNRVHINIQGRKAWFGCQIRRVHGDQIIKDVELADGWRDRLVKTLAINYKRAPHYQQAMRILEPLLWHDARLLADFNINAILTIAAALEIRTPTLRSSQLATSGRATERLISICRAAGADAYMCGGGADGYQEDDAFATAGIRLEYQNFAAPDYGSILGGSVIDFLMHQGPRPLP